MEGIEEVCIIPLVCLFACLFIASVVFPCSNLIRIEHHDCLDWLIFRVTKKRKEPVPRLQ